MILFPSSPLKTEVVDPDFACEWDAAKATGHETALYDHAALEVGNFRDAVRLLPKTGLGGEIVLRGWMMTDTQYSSLCEALSRHGGRMLVDPVSYAETHYLPLAYRHLEGETPRSAWNESRDVEDAWSLYEGFAHHPALIKDWVKSAKHRWNEACYLPAQTTRIRFKEIYGNFLRERGPLFNQGTVLREFVSLATKGHDLKGFPIVEEYRLFFWRKRLLVAPTVCGERSPLTECDRWTRLASRFSSPFLSIDVALMESGDWIVVEVGDGGVSGLPLSFDINEFYTALGAR